MLSNTQRWLLGEQLAEITRLDEAFSRLDEKVQELTLPFDQLIKKLCEIPGVSRRVAEVIVAEIGIDMSRFPTAKHLASWAGRCPGNGRPAIAPGRRWADGRTSVRQFPMFGIISAVGASNNLVVLRIAGEPFGCLGVQSLRTKNNSSKFEEKSSHDVIRVEFHD